MAKKDALKIYATEWIVAHEMLPAISYQAAKIYFHTVCKLLNFKNITIRENRHRKGAICIHLENNSHRIEIGRCTKLTEIIILHEIAHAYDSGYGHGPKYVIILKNLIREFLPNAVLKKWNYYRSKIQTLKTKDQIRKFYWDKMGEIQKVS